MMNSPTPKPPQLLFDELGEPIKGKPLILGKSPKQGWEDKNTYLYLGLEPVTAADYYQCVKGTILLPHSPQKGLMDQHYKVNCDHLYCMEAEELEALIDVNAHDLWKSAEISLEGKAQIKNSLLPKNKFERKFGILDQLESLYEKLKNFHSFEDGDFVADEILAINEKKNDADKNDSCNIWHVFNVKFNSQLQTIKPDLIYLPKTKKLFLDSLDKKRGLNLWRQKSLIRVLKNGRWIKGKLILQDVIKHLEKEKALKQPRELTKDCQKKVINESQNQER